MTRTISPLLNSNPSPKRDCFIKAQTVHMWCHLRSQTPTLPHIFFLAPPPLAVCLAGEGKQYQMWRLFFFFSVQSGIKTSLFGAGGCVALHRLGSLFIEMEEEGRKNKYTAASKHLLCLLDVMRANTVHPKSGCWHCNKPVWGGC